MDGIYKNIDTIQYNPNKKCKILIKFDYMIANILSNKKHQPVVTGLFIRSRKMNIPCAIKQIAVNHSSDIDSKRFCESLQNKNKQTNKKNASKQNYFLIYYFSCFR